MNVTAICCTLKRPEEQLATSIESALVAGHPLERRGMIVLDYATTRAETAGDQYRYPFALHAGKKRDATADRINAIEPAWDRDGRD